MLAGLPSQGAAFLVLIFNVFFAYGHASTYTACYSGPALHTTLLAKHPRPSSLTLLSHKYDGNKLMKKLTKEWWRIPQRLGTLGSPLFSWYALVRWDRFLGRADEPARIALHAKKLRESLISAGPACIKLGQALSNRPDIAGPIYAKELERLQDDVGPFNDKLAFDIIQKELGRPVSPMIGNVANELYEFVGNGPVASASLGQVYKARIRATGELVAIKVQRPEAFDLASIDISLLRSLAAYLKKSRSLRSDIVAIVDELGERLFCELNYLQEAQNCIKFRKLYGSLPGIVVPNVVESLTTRRVLTMEWMDGTKLPWGDDAERLIGIGLECSVYQLLEEGFLHADPHPGNLLRTKSGQLCYLDFGMMSEVDPEQRYGLVKAVTYLFTGDFDKLGDSMIQLGFVSSKDSDALVGFGQALKAAFTNASSGGSLLDLNFSKLASNIADVAYRFPIIIPPYWSLVIRCLAILEGIALQYNPEFKVVAGVYPYVLKYFLKSSRNPELQQPLKDILLIPTKEVEEEPLISHPDKVVYRIRWNRLESMLTASTSRVSTLSRRPPSETPVAVALADEVPLPLIPATLNNGNTTASLMISYFLSDEGAFLRDALVEDIISVIQELPTIMQRTLSLASGGFIAPPGGNLTIDRVRLSVVISLLNGFMEKASKDSSLLSAQALREQSAPLLQIGRQVVARLIERSALRASRRVFRGVLNVVHTEQQFLSRQWTSANRETLKGGG